MIRIIIDERDYDGDIWCSTTYSTSFDDILKYLQFRLSVEDADILEVSIKDIGDTPIGDDD